MALTRKPSPVVKELGASGRKKRRSQGYASPCLPQPRCVLVCVYVCVCVCGVFAALLRFFLKKNNFFSPLPLTINRGHQQPRSLCSLVPIYRACVTSLQVRCRQRHFRLTSTEAVTTLSTKLEVPQTCLSNLSSDCF